MKKHSLTQITSEQLALILNTFKAKQQARVIEGIFNNPGILTHHVSGKFCCNNVPDVAKNANPKLSKFGLVLVCTPQKEPDSLTKSYHWWLCSTKQAFKSE
jgi:hypothetical protein